MKKKFEKYWEYGIISSTLFCVVFIYALWILNHVLLCCLSIIDVSEILIWKIINNIFFITGSFFSFSKNFLYRPLFSSLLYVFSVFSLYVLLFLCWSFISLFQFYIYQCPLNYQYFNIFSLYMYIYILSAFSFYILYCPRFQHKLFCPPNTPKDQIKHNRWNC